MESKTAIIVGASSGIGLAIAQELIAKGYTLGLAARRGQILADIASANSQVKVWREIDVCSPDCVATFRSMVSELGHLDEVYLCSGIGPHNPNLIWEIDQAVIETNTVGFVRLALESMHLFRRQNHGHLIGISSISALFGLPQVPAYPATKAFISRYMQGLRMKIRQEKLPIHITDIRPGFVDTAILQGYSPFWTATPQKAAKQIVHAVHKRKKIVYVTKRWALIGWLARHLIA